MSVPLEQDPDLRAIIHAISYASGNYPIPVGEAPDWQSGRFYAQISRLRPQVYVVEVQARLEPSAIGIPRFAKEHGVVDTWSGARRFACKALRKVAEEGTP